MSETESSATEPNPPGLAELAHELRTPLAAIAATAEVLRDARLGPLGAPYREYARSIHDSASHALAVLSSWVERPFTALGRQQLAPTPLDINSVVARCSSILEPWGVRAGVRLTSRLAPGLPQVAADARTLQQILFNLVANAFAFTPPGGTVTIKTEASVAGVSVEVADTGDGMTPEELTRIRALAETPRCPQRPVGRTGYGLPLVFALTAANRGSLNITSAPREGTRVVLSFPALDEGREIVGS